MADTKPLVIVTRKLPEGIETRMRTLFGVQLNADDKPMDAAALKAAVEKAEVLVPTVTDRIGPDIIAAAGPQLKLIANFGVGYNHIDVKGAAAKRIQARQPLYFSYPDWRRLNTLEVARGRAMGRPRVKFTQVEAMLTARRHTEV